MSDDLLDECKTKIVCTEVKWSMDCDPNRKKICLTYVKGKKARVTMTLMNRIELGEIQSEINGKRLDYFAN